jgi:hypothetical protein
VIRHIDRLSRAAHRFHRFAHHPLCGRYESEVIRVGKRGRVCKGCSLAVLGAVCGAAAAVLLGPPWVAAAFVAIVGVAFAAASLSPGQGGSKWGTRFLPSSALGFGAVGGIVSLSQEGAILAAVVALSTAALGARYRRRGPNRAPCSTCPELDSQPCSGFLPIVRRERALVRASRRMLAPPRPSDES